MVDLVKGLREVHYDTVSLFSGLHVLRYIINEVDQLGVTRHGFSEAMLERVQDAVLVSLVHDATCDYVLH